MSELDNSKVLRGLNGTAIFQHIPDEVLIKISKQAWTETFKSEEVIVWEGEPSDRLFIVINGIVTVKKVVPNKSDKIFEYLLPGSTFGEVGILENKPRSATVSALTNVDVLIFERD